MSVGTIGEKLGSDSCNWLADFPFGSEVSEYRGGRAEAAVWIRVADLMSVRRRSSGVAAVYTLSIGLWNSQNCHNNRNTLPTQMNADFLTLAKRDLSLDNWFPLYVLYTQKRKLLVSICAFCSQGEGGGNLFYSSLIVSLDFRLAHEEH